MHPENRSPGKQGNKGSIVPQSILRVLERTKDSCSLKKTLQCDRYMSETKIPEMLRGAGREDPNVSGLTLTHDRPVQMNL
jgi:hypothetical protein